MGKALGLIEYKTVASGITACDTICKTAELNVLQSEAVCPGKYFVLFEGEIAAVKAGVEACKRKLPEKMIDSFVLGNPHESIFKAIWGTTTIEERNALGVLETYSVASAIVGADTAAKTADVKLIELRLARGLCGKSYLILTGSVAAVTEAINKAKAGAGEEGMFLDSTVIANPDPKCWEKIL